MRHVDLEDFAEGRLSAKLNKEFERVAKNIQDPNTDPTKERKVTVTIKIRPNYERDYDFDELERQLMEKQLGG